MKGLGPSPTSLRYRLLDQKMDPNSPKKYAKELFSLSHLTDSRVSNTPLELNAKLSRNDNPPLPDPTIYCCLVGSLIYLTMTQPDVSHVIQVVSQFAIVEGLVIEGSFALLLPP